MAQEELIRRLFAVVDAADWHRLGEVFAVDGVYRRPGYRDICGLAEIVRFYRDVRIIEQGRHELMGVIVDECQGSCWGRFRGVSRSGEALAEDFAEWYDFAGPVIAERRTFFYRQAI